MSLKSWQSHPIAVAHLVPGTEARVITIMNCHAHSGLGKGTEHHTGQRDVPHRSDTSYLIYKATSPKRMSQLGGRQRVLLTGLFGLYWRISEGSLYVFRLISCTSNLGLEGWCADTKNNCSLQVAGTFVKSTLSRSGLEHVSGFIAVSHGALYSQPLDTPALPTRLQSLRCVSLYLFMGSHCGPAGSFCVGMRYCRQFTQQPDRISRCRLPPLGGWEV